jgi:5,10-methenyltetrahydromethanopterin hydrogenase
MHNYICCSEKTVRRALKIERISIPTVYVPYLKNELINKFTNVKENNPGDALGLRPRAILINCDLKSSVTAQIYSKMYIITRKP